MKDSITDKVYTIDLYNTGLPVEVMIGFKKYKQNGTLAVELFTMSEEIAKSGCQDPDEEYGEHYAVITSNDCFLNLLEKDQQFVNEERYPGISDWLTSNGIGFPIEYDGSLTNHKGNPLFRFNFEIPERSRDVDYEEEMVTSHEAEVHPPVPETFPLMFMEFREAKEFRHNLIDILDKCEVLSDFSLFYRLSPDHIKRRTKDLVLEIETRKSEYERHMYTPDVPQLDECPGTAMEAKCFVNDYYEEHVKFAEETRTVFSGRDGYVLMVGVPTFDIVDISSPVKMQSKSRKNALRGEHFVSIDRFGRFTDDGPSYHVSMDGHTYFYPDPKHSYECWYTPYGTPCYFRSGSDEYTISHEYEVVVDGYRDKMLRLIEPLYAAREE